MVWLTVSETHELVSAVLDGLAKQEIPGPGGGPISARWFCWRASERRLVEQQSWHECAVMYERIRPFLERTLAEVAEGATLDLSFVALLCQGAKADGEEEEHERDGDVGDRRDELAAHLADMSHNDFLSKDEEIFLIKMSMAHCEETMRKKGLDAKYLMEPKLQTRLVQRVDGFLRGRFGVVSVAGEGRFSRYGQSAGELHEALVVRAGRLGVQQAELWKGNSEGELRHLKLALTLCDESIQLLGADATQLLREKNVKSLSAFQVHLALTLLRDTFGVLVRFGRASVTRDGKPLSALRMALSLALQSFNQPTSLVEPCNRTMEAKMSEKEQLRAVLRWCEASIKAHGEESNVLVAHNGRTKKARLARRLTPLMKTRFGVVADRGTRGERYTAAGSSLEHLRSNVFASLKALEELSRPTDDTDR